jgi:hypothetical protein
MRCSPSSAKLPPCQDLGKFQMVPSEPPLACLLAASSKAAERIATHRVPLHLFVPFPVVNQVTEFVGYRSSCEALSKAS